MTRDISLLEGLATTRAIRRYTADPIPDADLAEILWYAQRAPSGTNRQKFRFITLRRDDPVAAPGRALLADSFRKGWAFKQAELDREGRPDDGSPRFRMQAAMQHYVDHIDTVPVIVLVGLERYRPVNYAEGASVYPACQNLLLAARALVLPSFAEGLPVVIMEAMALKRPIISTFVAGIPELVRTGEHGWLVPAGDVKALVDAMLECLNTPVDTLERMGEAGHKHVLLHHNVELEAAKLVKLFECHRTAVPS